MATIILEMDLIFEETGGDGTENGWEGWGWKRNLRE